MKKIVVLCFYILFISCNTPDKETIEIRLNKTKEQTIAFNNMNAVFMAYSLERDYPKYYDYLKSRIIEFKKDTNYISTFVFYTNNFKYHLHKKGLLDENIKVDSLEERKAYLKPLNFFVEYSKGKQIITFDKNYNNIYEDDSSLVFKNDFRLNNEITLIDTLKSYKVDFYDNINDRTNTEKREIIFYPNSYSSYNGSLSDKDFINLSRIHIKFKDYWKSRLEIDKHTYDIAIQGIYPYLTFLIKHDTLSFSNSDINYNSNFEFNLKDTVELNKHLFILDSITEKVDKLFLTEIKSKKTYYNYRIGYKIENYKFQNLISDTRDSIFNIEDLNKKYTLLEFWGTWCKPCVQLTPRVKELFANYESELNILGVAYDRDASAVKEYIENNQLSWRHTFVETKYQKNSITDKLKIKQYPTFILIDNETRTIIYRGVGEEAIDKLEKLLNKY